MENNLQNFPRIYFQKQVSCIVPVGALPGQKFYFNPDGDLDESKILGVQFLPKDGQLVKNTYINGTQATSADGASGLINLVNKVDESIFQDYPINGLNNVVGFSEKRVVRTYTEISLKKCFITWNDITPANTLHFLFSFFYAPKK